MFKLFRGACLARPLAVSTFAISKRRLFERNSAVNEPVLQPLLWRSPADHVYQNLPGLGWRGRKPAAPCEQHKEVQRAHRGYNRVEAIPGPSVFPRGRTMPERNASPAFLAAALRLSLAPPLSLRNLPRLRRPQGKLARPGAGFMCRRRPRPGGFAVQRHRAFQPLARNWLQSRNVV
jgi:hypothetical protein